ncbi:MAG TPA: hypothetical protein VM076_06335 [Gemmatimonadaceae bacterium]|nr:hypothetical protein [Gemmatimonadaceae bacterium]
MRDNKGNELTPRGGLIPGDESGIERIGDITPHDGVSQGGHMRATAPGEMDGDAHGGGTAERGRDRSAGLGEGSSHEGADVSDERLVGGQLSAAESGRQIIDAIEEREPDRSPEDQSADPRTVPAALPE